jgi:hypothetical protein
MHSNATFFHETAGAYRQLTILFSHYGKKTCEVGNSTIKAPAQPQPFQPESSAMLG